jgi:hypothetical protein
MRSTFLGFSLAALLLVGCAPQRNGEGHSGGSSGQATGGSGGTAGSGGNGGSGGTSSTGGVTETGGSAGGGNGGDPGSGGVSGGEGGESLSTGGRARVAGADIAAGGAGGVTRPMGGTTGGRGGATTTTPGTGGKPGTGGAPGTGGNTAPTPCTFPSNWTPSGATYTTYSLPNPATACGYEGSNNTIKNIANGANFAAIPGNTPQDFNTRDRCGACVQIGNAIITIVDECPNDSNPPCKANPGGHLDLSNAGANAGGVRGDPALRNQNQWKFVPCPVNGNVVVRLKNGNNNEMYIENVIVPITAVNCDGQTGSRTYYGAWHFGQNIPGASCELTDLAGRKLTVTAGSAQGQNVDTGVQFPKCL